MDKNSHVTFTCENSHVNFRIISHMEIHDFTCEFHTFKFMWKFWKGFTTYITDHFQIIREKIKLQNFLKYMHRNNNLKLRRTIV